MKKLVFVACVFGVTMAWAQDPQPDETWYVSTSKLILREKPDALSKAVQELQYRDAATIKDVVRVALPFDGDKDKFPDTLIPNWVKVESRGKTGYLPVVSLASEWLIGNQNPEELVSSDGQMVARRGFSESEDKVELAAMRGFSEAENGDLVAMRGAMGKGSAAQSADPAAVERVLSLCNHPTDGRVAEFASEGKLKNGAARVTTELAQKKKGWFGGFMKSARKAGSSGLGLASKVTKSVAGDDEKLGAAASAGKLTSGLLYSEIGPVQEYQLGLALAARILPLYPVVPASDKAAKYVAEVGATLAAVSNDPTPYNGYSFLLVRSDEVNAFAVPGGFIFVTTGMLKFLRNEEELAAILGHEMGHVELRHGMSSVGKENVLKLFSLAKEAGASAAAKGHEGLAVEQLQSLADTLFDKMTTSIRNGYGIEMESQADWRSIQYLKLLGYDTAALHDVLERFKATKGSYGGASYPKERGADAQSYRNAFGCDEKDEVATMARTARYRAAVEK